RTMGFTTIAMFQVFNAMNCRSATTSIFKIGFTTNKYLLMGTMTSVTLQILATLLYPLQIALGIVPLSPWEWITIFLVSSLVFFAEELRKFVMNKIRRRRL
ncbi:MAG: cation-translocating P-type ATPase C-terminal domain-containing protein, partial [Nitrososphaerota archaeon]